MFNKTILNNSPFVRPVQINSTKTSDAFSAQKQYHQNPILSYHYFSLLLFIRPPPDE
jgi:hypothetical protein